jgi:putative adhesin
MAVAGHLTVVTSNTWPRPGRGLRAPRRTTVVLVAAALLVVALIVVVAATQSAGGTGSGPAAGTRSVSITAGRVGTVDLEGVPGQLTITASDTDQVRLTGQLHWSGHAPAASVRTGRTTAGAARVLHLDYVCAASSPCTEDYRLSVPARTAVAVSQPSGHVTISGLNAPLRISAGSVDVSASRLRSPTLTATITSGHLAAAFGVAPRRVSLTLTSAQATVHLPAVAPGYQLSQQVTSGYVHVGVTQAASSPHRVSVRISSGELELLP